MFGLGGLVLGGLVFPLVRLLVSDGPRRHAISREILRYAFRFFIELMRSVGVLSYELVGFERLERRGLLILANHPSLIDTPVRTRVRARLQLRGKCGAFAESVYAWSRPRRGISYE